MSSASVTPGQTVGPFFAFGLEYHGDSALVAPGTPGAIRLHGRVFDGAGEPVPDALVELWQAGPDGLVAQRSGSLRRDGFTFTGWGRAATDSTGHYSFTTVTPGAVQSGASRAPSTWDPPFFALTVFARGLLDRLFTRAYVPGHPDDKLLASLDPDRRETLVATPDEHGFVFHIRLQADSRGEGETVFLSYATTQD
jgi:protocatechuate 3,4-dioxygenase alpha subunit